MANIDTYSSGTVNYLRRNNVCADSNISEMSKKKRPGSYRHKCTKTIFSTNTLPNRLKRTNNSMKGHVDVIRYIPGQNAILNVANIENAQISNMFTPSVHSTPVYNNCNNNNRHFLKRQLKRNSIENSSIQDYLPHETEGRNEYEIYRLQTFANVPTISKRVEMENTQNLQELAAQNESKIIKRRGIRGVSWILRLALKDNSIGKIYRNQIAYIVFTMIILLMISATLVCFSKYFSTVHYVKFTNYTNISSKFEFQDDSQLNNSIYLKSENIVITTERVLSITVHHKITTRLTDFHEVNRSQIVRQDENKTENTIFESNSTNNDDNELTNICTECRKSLDVCITMDDSGVPVCKTAVDLHDPTGCGGLCALEVEACHLLNHKYSIYTCVSLETFRSCTSNEWRCRNNFCVLKEQQCDGEINCYDRSDEEDCNECDLSNNFHCGNGTSCLDNSKKCDGVLDCWDASDEINCTIICPKHQFTCNNGECISNTLFCDGLADCKDKSDEPHGCEECQSHEFKCANSRCIPKWRECNGMDNCGDMSDEHDCPRVKTS